MWQGLYRGKKTNFVDSSIQTPIRSINGYNSRETHFICLPRRKITMSIPTPALDKLSETLPDELKDIRLNLSSVLTGEHLEPSQALGIALACGFFVRSEEFVSALQRDLNDALGNDSEPIISDARAAGGIMAMNTVYYRFRHMIGKESYSARPARLRMNRMNQPTTTKADFELMSLGCAALAGCEMCLKSHESSLLQLNLSEEACHDAIRIAAVVNATVVGIIK
jgi:alkyl hydroperoxide reductase subunit D